MANLVRAGALKLFLDGDLDFLTHTFNLVLLEATYIYSAAHDMLNDVPAGDRAYTHTLTTKDSTDGVATAASAIVTIPAGPAITQAWIYRDTGVESTSPLVTYYNTDDSRQPFNFTPNGGDVLLSLPTLPYGLFKI